MSVKKVGVKKPKISANKLSEYIYESSPTRRNTILKDQKYPQGFVVTRYNGAKKSILDFFVHGKGNKEKIEAEIKHLILKSYSTPFQKQDNELSIKALEIFVNSKIPFDLNKHNTSRFGSNLNKILIEGVEVSVHPDILIQGSIRGKEFIGAIKIHISKSHPLNENSGKSVATLIDKFLETHYPGQKINRNFCISIDIFTGKYFTAPPSYISLRKNIEAACREIYLLWKDL